MRLGKKYFSNRECENTVRARGGLHLFQRNTLYFFETEPKQGLSKDSPCLRLKRDFEVFLLYQLYQQGQAIEE